NVHHIAHVELADIAFDWQCAGVFHGVEEDRRDLSANAHTAITLVGDVGNVVAGVPQHRVGGGFARRAGTHHVAYQHYGVAFLFQFGDFTHGVGDAIAWHLVHGQR